MLEHLYWVLHYILINIKIYTGNIIDKIKFKIPVKIEHKFDKNI